MDPVDDSLPSYRTLFIFGVGIGVSLITAAIGLTTLRIPSINAISLEEFRAIFYSGVGVIVVTLLATLFGLLARWGRELVTFREITSRHKTDEALIKLALPHPWLKDIIIPHSKPGVDSK